MIIVAPTSEFSIEVRRWLREHGATIESWGSITMAELAGNPTVDNGAESKFEFGVSYEEDGEGPYLGVGLSLDAERTRLSIHP